MKKSAICITLATLALAGCNNDEKNAQARLDNARSMYEQNEFFAAKNEIDSIRILPERVQGDPGRSDTNAPSGAKGGGTQLGLLRQPDPCQATGIGRIEERF